MLVNFVFMSSFAFNSAFVANVTTFWSVSAELADLSTEFLLLMLLLFYLNQEN